MNNNELLQPTAALIVKSLHLDDNTFADVDAFEALRQRVRSVVENMLEHDPQRFINMLYIMDISEKKVAEVLRAPKQENDDVYLQLADVIIARELKKVETRLAYKEKFTAEEDGEKW
ncbi:MAG: hypothetical protein R2798_02695 [Chitinophagales bacterium]|nr:hypothetical protein [Bacteroidota bacterium]MCB9042237.1 hypothetical protein [Chitinophagales bacterium]